jgi:putative PIN family toxin of toxin-antitoxin system
LIGQGRVLAVTLDVNVLASGLVMESGVPAQLLERWANGHFSLVISEHIVHGLSHTWQKPYFDTRFPPSRREDALTLPRELATFVEPASNIAGIAPAAEDDLILATDVAGKVRFLVTGDKPLQSLGSYQSIPIISPRAFLDVLNDE